MYASFIATSFSSPFLCAEARCKTIGKIIQEHAFLLKHPDSTWGRGGNYRWSLVVSHGRYIAGVSVARELNRNHAFFAFAQGLVGIIVVQSTSTLVFFLRGNCPVSRNFLANVWSTILPDQQQRVAGQNLWASSGFGLNRPFFVFSDCKDLFPPARPWRAPAGGWEK